MNNWLTSMDRKTHQRAINRMVRAVNNSLEQDKLWCGRFVIRQVQSPRWIKYSDGSGAEYWVCLKFVDRATGRYYVKWNSVNIWRGLTVNGYRIWALLNWLIAEHWDIWQEDFARNRNYDAWREYNKNTRVNKNAESLCKTWL